MEESSPTSTEFGEDGERRLSSKWQGPAPSDWAMSALKSIVCFSLGDLMFWGYGLRSSLHLVPPSFVLSVKTAALSGFAGKRSEYCDPFEVVEVLLLCLDANCDKESSPEMPGGCFSAFAGDSTLNGWGKVKELLGWCCKASWDNEKVPARHVEVLLVGLEKVSVFAGRSVLCESDWMCVFPLWCCEASPDSESVCAGAAIPRYVTAVMLLWGVWGELLKVGLQFECSCIKSANDGLPFGSAMVALLPFPTPNECWLLNRTELRLPNPGGTARGELAVILGLCRDRLPSETGRRGGAELWDAGEMLKDANVPNERLFWLGIMDSGELSPMVRALKEWTPKPSAPVPLLFCSCADMSCARLAPQLTPGPLFWLMHIWFSELPTTGAAACCNKRSLKFGALVCPRGCVCLHKSVWCSCALDVMSLWEADKQAPYLTKANCSCQRVETRGPQNRIGWIVPLKKRRKRTERRHFVKHLHG